MTVKWIYLGLFTAILATAAAITAAEPHETASVGGGPGTAEVLAPEQAILSQEEFNGPGLLACPDCQGADAGPWFTGADYRLIRTHFSEALAFVQVNDSLTARGFERQVQAQELN